MYVYTHAFICVQTVSARPSHNNYTHILPLYAYAPYKQFTIIHIMCSSHVEMLKVLAFNSEGSVCIDEVGECHVIIHIMCSSRARVEMLKVLAFDQTWGFYTY